MEQKLERESVEKGTQRVGIIAMDVMQQQRKMSASTIIAMNGSNKNRVKVEQTTWIRSRQEKNEKCRAMVFFYLQSAFLGL